MKISSQFLSWGNLPHGDLNQVGPEDMLGYEYVNKRDIGRGRFLSPCQRRLHGTPYPRRRSPPYRAGHPVEPQNRCRGLHGQECCVQATPPQQPHRGVVSANPNYAPINATEEMVIIGRVIKIERNLVTGWQP